MISLEHYIDVYITNLYDNIFTGDDVTFKHVVTSYKC